MHDKDRNKNRREVEKLILFVNNYLDNKQFGLSAWLFLVFGSVTKLNIGCPLSIIKGNRLLLLTTGKVIVLYEWKHREEPTY